MFNPRVAREFGGVRPLESLGADRAGNNPAGVRLLARVGLGDLGLLDELLQVPGEGGNATGGREDGLQFRGTRLGGELAGEGIRLAIAGPGSVRQGKIEMS